LEKLGIRPERLQLEWISAAEGQKFAKVMRHYDTIRQDVTEEEVEYTQKVFKAQQLKGSEKKKAMEKLKSPCPPQKLELKPLDNGHKWFKCMSCDHLYNIPYDPEADPVELSCPKPECKSNSIRHLKG